ncbi:NAD(P)H-hydrate dehydratase [Nanoarchaeota archaeon]
MKKKTFLKKSDVEFPKRSKTSHKGQNGKVLIVGGSPDYVGALALAGLAALRSGADWVTIAAPEKTAWAISSLSKDLITKKFPCEYFTLDQVEDILSLSKDFDVVLIGNGLGTDPETQKFVRKIAHKIEAKKVIDADGIKAISLQEVTNTLFTPHLGELNILLKNSKIKREDLQRYIDENVILLKGPSDTIITHDRTMYNQTGNAGMTKAGTGDVLAGLCAGYLAQSDDLFQSACNAAYINGLIGDILLKKKQGFTYLASDMVDEILNVSK